MQTKLACAVDHMLFGKAMALGVVKNYEMLQGWVGMVIYKVVQKLHKRQFFE